MKFNKNRSKDSGNTEPTRIERVNHMTLKCVLTVGLRYRVIYSAHHLTERNIWVNFNENRPKGSGDMERTQSSSLNPLTLSLW